MTNQVTEVVIMKNKKDNQAETIIIEMTAWAFIIGIVYIIVKLSF